MKLQENRGITLSSRLQLCSGSPRFCSLFGQDPPDLCVAGGASCAGISLLHDAADCHKFSLISRRFDFRSADLQAVADDFIAAAFFTGSHFHRNDGCHSPWYRAEFEIEYLRLSLSTF